MANVFDHVAWAKIITRPDWYIHLYPELKELLQQWYVEPDSERTTRAKEEVLSFFEAALEHNHVALATSGPDLDAQRKPIDTIVIHHSSHEPGYQLAQLNAVQLLRVYVPYFNHPVIPGEEQLKGQLMWSNHVQEGRPVFYAYHWLLRMDGTAERLLEDDQIGWHAGNWEVNCRSVGICLDNDYEQQNPAPEVVRALADFITHTYPQVNAERVFGHCDVGRRPTICPGGEFKTTWKAELLELLRSR